MIKGTGELISNVDEEGNDLPFLTTDQILEQIAKFGFIVVYDLKSNLPSNVLSYLSQLYNLDYDKITRINVKSILANGEIRCTPTIIVMKSYKGNDDLLTFDCTIGYKQFCDKLVANSIMDVTDEPGMVWDWVTYMANLKDILDENVDPTDDFETKTDIEVEPFTPYQPSELDEEGNTGSISSEGLTPYQSEEIDNNDD